MTNQDIETFFAVLDHGTMTAAAEALYITQPSLSARLKSLEDQVGAPLFHHGKGQRRITLTDAGQHFLPLARRWQNLLSETQTFAAAEKREFLHVIAAYTANQYILPPVYQRFLERELPVNLWVESMRTDQAVSAVARATRTWPSWTAHCTTICRSKPNPCSARASSWWCPKRWH